METNYENKVEVVLAFKWQSLILWYGLSDPGLEDALICQNMKCIWTIGIDFDRGIVYMSCENNAICLK